MTGNSQGLEPIFSVSDFVAVFNQTLEYAYPSVVIVGELANFRVSKNRWVYFDLQDEHSSVKFFGTVYQLPGPLEDGLMLQVRGVPRLHPKFGFSVSVQLMQPVGEGSIKKAAALLQDKLTAEGLFDDSRKRSLPYPPRRIGLITSSESAAHKDFLKILNVRWGGIEILHYNTQVQGEAAVGQLVAAFDHFNSHAEPVEVLVLTRGGGSADDLAVFNTEQVTRAIAASRVPTMVAIGHEVDVSLAELAADRRASTPSNAAELLTPDRKHELQRLQACEQELQRVICDIHNRVVMARKEQANTLHACVQTILTQSQQVLTARDQLLKVLSPQAALNRGYAIMRQAGKVVGSGKYLDIKKPVTLQLYDAQITADVTQIELQ